MNKLTIMMVAIALLSGCVSLESYEEETRHYRSSERFAHVAIDVNFDIDLAEVPAEFSDLPGMVEVELIHYLGQHGVDVSAAGGTADNADHARLDVTLQDGNIKFGSYDIAARLTDVDGAVIDETTLHHRAGISSPRATAQQLAEVIADDMLMIWHPAISVIGEKFPSTGAARYALLPFGTEVDAEEQTSRFTWESFPSERMLQGANFSAENIDNVVYEFRLIPYSKWRTSEVMYRSTGLAAPEHNLPFTLPSCEHMFWSVRARFNLYGVPRVTEWSARQWRVAERRHGHRVRVRMGALMHQTGGPWGGIRVKQDVPASVDCKVRDWSPDEALSRLDLDPLQAGQSIGAIALVSEVCGEDGCESRTSTQEASEQMAACLAEEFLDSDLNVSVHDIAKLMADLPTPPETDDEVTDTADLLTYLRLPENKDYLGSLGIRYVVTADISIKDVGSSDTYRDQARKYDLYTTVAAPGTNYVATVDSIVFDVSKGDVAATIGSTVKGSKGAYVPVFVIVPVGYIPFGSVDKIQNRACGAMARRLSFALRGGVSGWPEGFFEDVYAPRWEHNGE